MTGVGCPPKRKLPPWMCEQEYEEDKTFIKFPGQVVYCSTVDEMNLACEKMISSADKLEELVLGFDAEWPVFPRGPGKIALVQICMNESLCYLFHVSCMPGLPKSFIDLINHAKIKLTGSCIQNDIWKLGRDFDVPVAKLIGSGRVIDLCKFANEVLYSAQRWSLDRLTLHVLSSKLDKRPTIRISRWDKELSSSQRDYAATDAYVSLKIYAVLKSRYH